PRLPRALPARLAHPQAEGDAPGPSRAAPGGPSCGVERPPGEPAVAVAAPVAPDPLADGEEELDAAATEDDGEGGPRPCRAGMPRRRAAGGCHVRGPNDSGSGRRAPEGDPGSRSGRWPGPCRNGPGARPRGPVGGLSAVGRSVVTGSEPPGGRP